MNRTLNISQSYESDLISNTWNPTSYNNAYLNAFEYDAMGNILTQQRHKRDGTKIEEMSYKYQYANGKLQRNRLYHINDAVSASVDNTDIDDQGTFDPLSTNINQTNNYKYDEEGRLVRDIAEDIAKITWRVDGKVKEIQRGSDTSKRFIRFDYDAMGHRIAKHIYDNTGIVLKKSTYYILDAQGNQVSMYEHEVQQTVAEFNLVERNMFGSSRIGTRKDNINMLNPEQDSAFAKQLGHKLYEFTNHLGNVLIVFTDVKTPQDQDANGTVDAYRVCLQNTFDYSPFGVTLDGRTMQGDAYRYGFNGMEKDDEVKGSGNSYTTHFRQLDPRVGRWFSIDPEVNRFAWSSGYLAFSNCPIVMIDPNGNTDYYNSRGKWIASDGIKNNEVRMALKSKTARAIIKDMKANKVKTLGEYNQKDIVQVPGDPVLKEMGRIWGETTSGKTEYVMAVGSLCDGQESFATLQGTEKDAPAGQAIKKLKGYGYSALYTIHTHPLYSESSKDDGSGATVSTPDPSMGDVKAAQSFEDTEPLFHNNGLQSIVIGPTYHYVDKESSYGSFKVIGKEKVLKRGEDMISFYNHTNTTTTEGKEMNDSIPINTTMKPNASISYKKFMKAAQRANNDENQRNNN